MTQRKHEQSFVIMQPKSVMIRIENAIYIIEYTVLSLRPNKIIGVFPVTLPTIRYTATLNMRPIQSCQIVKLKFDFDPRPTL